MHIKKMKLPPADARRCIDLLSHLDNFALETLNVFKEGQVIDIDNALGIRAAARDCWMRKRGFIEKFIKANDNLSDADIHLLKSWKNYKRASYVLISYTPEHAVFYSETDNRFYGVLALTQTFQEVLPYDLPIFLEMCLLPYEDYIFWDGIVNVVFILPTRVMKKTFACAYEKAKSKAEIITKL